MNQTIELKQEVREALGRGGPVIALESTIIAHGLPYPQNIETALAVEGIARELGVVPATVGIIQGRLRVGLSQAEIERLGGRGGVLKVSRKDLSYALAGKLSGATTVGGTMIAARLAGIEVFATGGIGGVHRGAEHSFDLSSDLVELSRNPLVVVSAGAKAILDLAKTLEVLETLGVSVVGYRTEEFPAFYSRSSGLRLEQRVENPAEIARLFTVQRQLQLGSALLVANPIPAAAEIPPAVIQGYVEGALEALQQEGIVGKEVTPFLLSRIVELSGGEALEANISLVKNNVHLAAQIALSLQKPPIQDSGP